MTEAYQAILNGSVALGLSVVFIALIVYVVTVTMPNLWEQIREDRRADQSTYGHALEKQQELFTETLRLIEDRWRETAQAICERLDRLTTRVDVLDSRRHPQHAATDWERRVASKQQQKEDGE